MTDLRELAHELDLLRRRAAGGTRKARVSLTDLAARVSLPRSTVHTYVAATTFCPAEALDRIVIALGASPAEQAQWSEAWYRVAGNQHDRRRAVAQATPRQLPPGIPGFTGRHEALAALDANLSSPEGTMAISAVAGAAGVGKTALAVHWAHRVADRFPDGQLFMNLRGYDPGEPVRAVDALARLLRVLGVPPGEVPPELDDAVPMYRSLLASRRVLVVLDNAGSAEQVRPLLPGAAGCSVLVTSREDLGGLIALDGALPVRLNTLPPTESLALLAGMIGAGRLGREPAAAAELATLCGHLPLALRIAGAHLVSHPERTVEAYARDLADGNRITKLAIPEDPKAAVRSAFDLSYATLTFRERRLFRALGLVPGGDFTVAAAAAVAGSSVAEAEQDLHRLETAHLLRPGPHGRYLFHDLIRLYATERATTEECPQDREHAMGNLLAHYLGVADAAHEVLYPHRIRVPPRARAAAVEFADSASALRWLEAELPNLTAAIQHAVATAHAREACLLADAIRGYFPGRGHGSEQFTVATTALRAASEANDPLLAASAHLSLAEAHAGRGRYTPAIEHSASARTLALKAGWTDGESTALGRLGTIHRETGRLRDAATCFRQALDINTRLGARHKQVLDLMNLGVTHALLGDLTEAADLFGRAHEIGHEPVSPSNTAMVLQCLGNVHRYLGLVTEAVGFLTEALAISRAIDEAGSQAGILDSLAGAHTDSGRQDDAMLFATQALSLARQVGARRTETAALVNLGAIHLAQGDHRQSLQRYGDAHGLATDIGHLAGELDALIGLACANTSLGHHRTAGTHADAALALSRRSGHRLQEGQALTALADNALASRSARDAARLAHEALTVHSKTGYRLGEARTLRTLGHAMRRLVDIPAAHTHWQAAVSLLTDINTSEAEALRRVIAHDS
ncbi:ATP-binding protein [Actinophytocola oryzae]|uniref:ATP-binding protein n=1 Tax=Actinophytocola oryzae TaxID=502181 RepID=UPI00141512C8|nr:tetratricopeptide repeat protein [Actinophytocola oryzae]